MPSFVSSQDYGTGWLVVRWGCIEGLYDLDNEAFVVTMWEWMTGPLSRRVLTKPQAYVAILTLELGGGWAYEGLSSGL